MNTKEFDKLWRLFEELFPAAVKKKGINGRTVWERAMSPYSLEEATEATMKYARQNKFFPDVADITGGLTPVEPEREEARPDPAFGDYSFMKKHVAALRDAGTALEARYHAAGVFTLTEAKRQGMDYAKWEEMCRSAGVWK